MRAILIAGLLVLAALSPRPAHAADPKLELIREVIGMFPIQQSVDAMRQGMAEQLRQQLLARAPGEADKAETLITIMHTTFDEVFYDLIPITVALMERELDRVFTEDDLKNLLAFYRSETGQKALTEMPAMMQRSGQLSQQIVMQRMPVLQQKLRARMQDAGFSLQ